MNHGEHVQQFEKLDRSYIHTVTEMTKKLSYHVPSTVKHMLYLCHA